MDIKQVEEEEEEERKKAIVRERDTRIQRVYIRLNRCYSYSRLNVILRRRGSVEMNKNNKKRK